MCCHGSYISSTSTNQNNRLVDCKLCEPVIGYVIDLELYESYLWKLGATYPSCTVELYDNNISGAFLQLNHPPNIARGNISLHGNKIIFLCSPSLWWKLWSSQLGTNSICTVISYPYNVQSLMKSTR